MPQTNFDDICKVTVTHGEEVIFKGFIQESVTQVADYLRSTIHGKHHGKRTIANYHHKFKGVRPPLYPSKIRIIVFEDAPAAAPASATTPPASTAQEEYDIRMALAYQESLTEQKTKEDREIEEIEVAVALFAIKEAREAATAAASNQSGVSL